MYKADFSTKKTFDLGRQDKIKHNMERNGRGGKGKEGREERKEKERGKEVEGKGRREEGSKCSYKPGK